MLQKKKKFSKPYRINLINRLFIIRLLHPQLEELVNENVIAQVL